MKHRVTSLPTFFTTLHTHTTDCVQSVIKFDSGYLHLLLLECVHIHDQVCLFFFNPFFFRTTVSETQKHSIAYFHFYFLNVLDNDLFLAINDGQTYYAYQSDVFETNPALAKLCFDYDVPSVDLHNYIYTVWCCLSTDLKVQVYNRLMN